MWRLLGVIPAKAGIQSFQTLLDPGFLRGDGVANEIFLKLTALGPTPERPEEIEFITTHEDGFLLFFEYLALVCSNAS